MKKSKSKQKTSLETLRADAVPCGVLSSEEIIDNTDVILTGVVLKKCPVVAYNPFSGVIVYVRDGIKVQSNCLDYDGSGFVEVE